MQGDSAALGAAADSQRAVRQQACALYQLDSARSARRASEGNERALKIGAAESARTALTSVADLTVGNTGSTCAGTRK